MCGVEAGQGVLGPGDGGPGGVFAGRNGDQRIGIVLSQFAARQILSGLRHGRLLCSGKQLPEPVRTGGGNPGVLPDSFRSASAGASGVYLLLAAAAGTSLVPTAVRRRVLYGTAGLMVVGAVMNLASPSWVERMIGTPVTAALAVLLWKAAKAK